MLTLSKQGDAASIPYPDESFDKEFQK